MTFRTLVLIKAAVCVAFGLFLLLAPTSLFGLLGATLTAGGSFAAREYGAAMIGIVMLAWLAKDVESSRARAAILWDLFVYDGIGVVITVAAVLNGVLNALGWGIVVVYAFFTVGSGYLLLSEPRRAPTQAPRAA